MSKSEVEILLEANMSVIIKAANRLTTGRSTVDPAIDKDDLIQAGMIRALQAIPRYEPGTANLSTYLARCATNAMVDVLRRTNKRARMLSIEQLDEADPDRLNSEGEYHDVVGLAVVRRDIQKKVCEAISKLKSQRARNFVIDQFGIGGRVELGSIGAQNKHKISKASACRYRQRILKMLQDDPEIQELLTMA